MNTFLDKGIVSYTYNIEGIDLLDTKMSIRLQELGFVRGNVVEILRFSAKRETVLLNILGSMFAMKTAVASKIRVSKI